MKLKSRERLSREEAAARLEVLAQAFSRGELKMQGRVFNLPPGPVDLTLKVEEDEDELEVEVKISLRSIEVHGPLSGKVVKKEMEALFKILIQEVTAGRLPKKEEAERFLELHRLYAPLAKGFREAWTAATRLAEELLSAVGEGDLAAVRGLLERIALSKKTCHKLYKK